MSFEHDDSEISEAARGAARDAAENIDEPTPGLDAAVGPWSAESVARKNARSRAASDEADEWRRAHGWVRGWDGRWRER